MKNTLVQLTEQHKKLFFFFVSNNLQTKVIKDHVFGYWEAGNVPEREAREEISERAKQCPAPRIGQKGIVSSRNQQQRG